MNLEVRGLSRAFGGVRAVDEVDFAVASGEVLGLIGPNGAGKTTVLNLVSGLLRPDAGSIALGGSALQRLPAHRIAKLGVARTYQNIRLFGGLSAEDNVVVGRHLFRRPMLAARFFALPSAKAEQRAAREKARALLDRVGLAGRRGDRASNLSYGEQRRLEIARALAAEPRVLLLDEPTAGMNATEAAAIAALVREVAAEGRAVVLIEHNVPLVMRTCDRITVLNFGKVIARGAPDAVAKDAAVIDAYLGGAP